MLTATPRRPQDGGDPFLNPNLELSAAQLRELGEACAADERRGAPQAGPVSSLSPQQFFGRVGLAAFAMTIAILALLLI